MAPRLVVLFAYTEVGMHGWLRVVREELRRRTEPPNGVIKFAIIYKGIGSALLLLSAVLLLGLVSDTLTSDRLRNFLIRTGLDSDNRLAARLFVTVGLISGKNGTALAVVGIFYGVLEAAEATGLALRRRWAEYLLLVATVVLLPAEALELVRRFTVLKVLLLIVNVALAVYLVRAKGLFQVPRGVRAEERAGLAPEAP